MEDLISIIIPVYNTEKLVGKLLNCLHRQTYKNLQIIVINDGSTDNSLSVIKEHAQIDNRIEIIDTPNNGVSIARNYGLDRAKGDYITFLDSDDYINDDMYEKIMEKMKEKNVSLIRCNFQKEDENNNIISKGNMLELSNKILSAEKIREVLIPYIFENKIETYTPLMMIKADIIKNVSKFNSDIHMMEDLLFCLEIFLSIDSMYFLDYPCYHYIFSLSSSSKARKNILRNFNDTLKVVKLVEEMLKKNNLNEEILKEVYHIYSTMIVKYTLRTFQKEDEYKLSYDEIIALLNRDDVFNLVKDVDFSKDNSYISTAGKLIRDKEYKKLYDYAESIKDIAI